LNLPTILQANWQAIPPMFPPTISQLLLRANPLLNPSNHHSPMVSQAIGAATLASIPAS
jgi:hypothetical protein